MAEPTGEHVVRGGKAGGLNQYNYDATSEGNFAGWSSVDANAGAVGMTGESGDHFSAAMEKGASSNPAKQT